MRLLTGSAAATLRRGGGHRLTLKAATGELIAIDLSPESAAALRESLVEEAPPARHPRKKSPRSGE